MREPKPRKAPINNTRKRGWSQRFATYRAELTVATVDDWMSQFDPEHQDVAARLLDAVEFYSASKICSGFRTALQSLPGWNLAADVREGTWRFAGLSTSAGESGDSMLHLFRIANRLDTKQFNELFIHPSEIVTQKLGNADTLILVDDFSGSGRQVCEAWSQQFAELVAGIGRVFLLVVAASSKAVSEIKDNTDLRVLPGHTLSDGDNLFSTACKHFTGSEKDAVLAYCRKASKNLPKGFDDCGFVVVFSHRCPNNSIAVLHAQSTKWDPLFPRHEPTSEND